jgi:hypothetical protein
VVGGGKQVAGRATSARGWGLGQFWILDYPLPCADRLLPTAYCLLLPGVSPKSGARLFSDLSNLEAAMSGYQKANTFVKSTQEFAGTVML